jgi:hypothetical protein
MAFLDGTIVYVAPPAIGRDFHASTSSLQCVLNGYLLWFTISDDALQAEPRRRGAEPVPVSTDYACPVAGPSLRTPDASPAPA